MVKSLLLLAVLAMGAAAAPPAGVPSGAQQIEDSRWRHVDTSGKAWIYMPTPFGVARMPAEQAAAPDQAKAAARPAARFEVIEVRADEIVFQRATPFGKPRWTKPVSGLTDDERAAVEAAANHANHATHAKK